MLQALLQAELQALLEARLRAKPEAELPTLLQAEIHPPWRRGDGGGSYDLHKTQRNLEEEKRIRTKGKWVG